MNFSSQTLTTEEAAKYLGVGSGTLQNWRSQGRGPKFLKIGRAVRYHKETLDRFLAESEVQQTV